METMEDKALRKLFADNLNYWARERGIRQDDIIRKYKLTSSTVSSWFTGARLPRMNKIQMLADYLGIDKSDLLEPRKADHDKAVQILIEAVNGLGREEILLLVGMANKMHRGDKE